MELLHYLRLARRSWPLIVLSLIIASSAAAVVTANTPPSYTATTSMIVSGTDKESDLSTAYQSGMLSAQRVTSYASLLTSRRVLSKITDPADLGRLQSAVTAEAIPGTVLLRATVTDADPVRAARLANNLGETFSKLIDQIERPTPKSRPAVKVTVVDRATVPTVPVSPKPLVNQAVALLLALLLAMATVVLRDRLDTTIKTIETLQDTSKTSILGIIGYEKDAQRHPLVLRETGHSTRAEAFRSLRTNLQFIGVDRQPKTLVVTSSLPSEGKSSTSVNLAITLAQAGWRVVLVDADLRRPRIPSYLGIEGAAGLTDVLIDKAGLQDVTQVWGTPGISVLPSGKVPPNPSELLGSQNMRMVLAQLSRDYDIVVIDAPPLLPVTDAAALAAFCDATLLVARYGKTRREHVVRAVELLTSVNARLVGAVLNFAPAKSGHYYGYGYGYSTDVKTPVNA
ncbi:polysaccharide biosynthesis tyrosine autokinase [Microtetraspora glauca]|uniref:non-specific protein-tyrosine kinase n=1 Tax=Microtetraspora glauca TaxID=1996 RepID=A0ABV3G901_MICGL